MKSLFGFFSTMLFSCLLIGGLAVPALAQDTGEISAPAPRIVQSPVRLNPVVGTASFGIDAEATLDNFDRSSAFGLLVDVGTGRIVFESGLVALQTRGEATGNTAAFTVDSFGIPLLGKWNISGNPHSTVFLKAGAMPFRPSGDNNDIDVLGVGGLGGAIPVGQNSAITLDAAYNRLVTDNGVLNADYQGFTFLAGLSLGL